MNFPIAYSTFGALEREALIRQFDSGRTTMGEKVAGFEDMFARYLGVSDAVMVNSGSSADLVIMLAARETGMLKVGDTVLLPAVTWPTQAWAAIEAGFKPKLAEVDPSTLNMAPLGLIPPEARAIFATHLMGNPCDMDDLRKHGVLIFEDCCEALGSTFRGQKVGTFGKASAFSFFHSHHISTMEGGMIATNDRDFAECCRQLRAHGWIRDLKNPPRVDGDKRYHFTGRGFNFRPTELQGALGIVQLSRILEFNHWRNHHAEFLRVNIDPVNGNPVRHASLTHFESRPAWFAMPFVLQEDLPYDRADVFDYLGGYGIETRPLVGGNLARQPAFQKFRKLSDTTLDGADVLHDRGFYIGLPPMDADLWPIVNLFQSMHSQLMTSSNRIRPLREKVATA